MIFVPANWIHATINPGTSIGIGYQQDSLREKRPTMEAHLQFETNVETL
jgi:hypothetical protein